MMNKTIAILSLILFVGCTTSEYDINKEKAKFAYRKEYILIEFLYQYEPLLQGQEIVIPESKPNEIQLSVANIMHKDIFVHIHIQEHYKEIIPQNDDVGSRRRLTPGGGGSSGLPENEFVLLRGTLKTRNNRMVDTYVWKEELPDHLNHYKIEGIVTLTYYFLGDPQKHIKKHNYNFIIKRNITEQSASASAAAIAACRR